MGVLAPSPPVQPDLPLPSPPPLLRRLRRLPEPSAAPVPAPAPAPAPQHSHCLTTARTSHLVLFPTHLVPTFPQTNIAAFAISWAICIPDALHLAVRLSARSAKTPEQLIVVPAFRLVGYVTLVSTDASAHLDPSRPPSKHQSPYVTHRPGPPEHTQTPPARHWQPACSRLSVDLCSPAHILQDYHLPASPAPETLVISGVHRSDDPAPASCGDPALPLRDLDWLPYPSLPLQPDASSPSSSDPNLCVAPGRPRATSPLHESDDQCDPAAAVLTSSLPLTDSKPRDVLFPAATTTQDEQNTAAILSSSD